MRAVFVKFFALFPESLKNYLRVKFHPDYEYSLLWRERNRRMVRYTGRLANLTKLSLKFEDSDGNSKVNLLLPALRQGSMSGGPNTALQLAAYLARKKVRVQLISTDVPPEKNQELLWKHIHSISGVYGPDYQMEIADGTQWAPGAKVSKSDIFIGTAWWTVQKLKPYLSHMECEKFIYFIQDFEPGLYCWNSEYALSLETYALDHLPIVNSNILLNYFKTFQPVEFLGKKFDPDAVGFQPAILRKNFYFSKSKIIGKKRILFYARPGIAARNLFDLGLKALSILIQSNEISTAEWDIFFIGESTIPKYKVGPYVIEALPWMNFETYCRELRNSDIVIGLMLSPHPSYTPLEAAAAGCIAITNTYPGKSAADLEGISKNILAAAPTLDSIVDRLRVAVRSAEDLELRKKNSAINLPESWEESFQEVIPKIVDFLKTKNGFEYLK